MQSIIELVNHYGYVIIFCSLLLELIAFPLPGEIMMTYCGFLVYQSKMNWFLTVFFAAIGALSGITISYFAGTKLGSGFFKKYGSYIHLGPERLEKTSLWFNNYRNKLLIISCFIPGVRHITGYFSGITKIAYKKFALNAYLGAVIWTFTFIFLGKTLGPNWDKFHSFLKKYMFIGSSILALILILIYAYKNHRAQIIEFTYNILRNTMVTFHSIGKLKAAISVGAVTFMGFFVLVIGLIQDFLAHEFYQFDTIVSYLLKTLFTDEWSYPLRLFRVLTSMKILIPLTVIILIWIMKTNQNPFLEIRFLFTVIYGVEVFQFLLRHIFRRVGPTSSGEISAIQYTFPSYQSLMSIVAYGFFTFIIMRHTKKAWIGTFLIIVTLIISVFSGLNPLYFQAEYPSDIYAGYIFGGMWLTINIILLEVYRILPKIQV